MRPTVQELSRIIAEAKWLEKDPNRAIWDAAIKAERESRSAEVEIRGVPTTDEMIRIYESGPGKGDARHGLGLRVLWNAATIAERERCKTVCLAVASGHSAARSEGALACGEAIESYQGIGDMNVEVENGKWTSTKIVAAGELVAHVRMGEVWRLKDRPAVKTAQLAAVTKERDTEIERVKALDDIHRNVVAALTDERNSLTRELARRDHCHACGDCLLAPADGRCEAHESWEQGDEPPVKGDECGCEYCAAKDIGT